MNRLANVLIAGAETPRTDRLRTLLQDNTCNAFLVAQADKLLVAAREEQPDLIIIDLASGSGDGMALAGSLRADAETAHVPIVAWSEREDPELYPQAMELGIDDVYSGAPEGDELFLRLHPLMRLSTQLAEMRRRTEQARKFGADIPAKPDLGIETGPFSILLAACDEARTAAIESALAGNARLSHCELPISAREMLFDGKFDAAVVGVADADSVEAVLAFCDEVRNNPRLFNLPIVILPEPNVSLDVVTALRGGASRLLEGPETDAALRYVLTSLGNRQRRRWRISGAIRATRVETTVDTATGAYSDAFLRSHLEVLITEARQGQRHMTLLSFAFPETLGVMKTEFGEKAAANLVDRVAQWITRLVRLEDLVAYKGDSEFYVALPDTPLAVAETVMQRVAGILDYTDFAVDDVYRPIKISVSMGAAEFQPDDDAAALVSRSHDNLG